MNNENINWEVTPSEVSDNKAFETIESLKTRIKLLKALGMGALYQKGVDASNDTDLYSIINAINRIPISTGYPRQITPLIAQFLNFSELSGSCDIKLMTVPGEGKVSSILQNYSLLSAQKDKNKSKILFEYNAEIINNQVTCNLSTRIGNSLLSFVLYSKEEGDDTATYQVISTGWTKLGSFTGISVNQKLYIVDYYIKDTKTSNRQEEFKIQIIETSNTNFAVQIVELLNYNKTPQYREDLSLSSVNSLISVKKDTNNPILWVMYTNSNGNNPSEMSPDEIDIFRTYVNNNQLMLMFYDNDNHNSFNIKNKFGSALVGLGALELI